MILKDECFPQIIGAISQNNIDKYITETALNINST